MIHSNLVLHSYRRCPFAIRVRMVLEEKGLTYQKIEENLSNFSAELLQHHPEGRVPLLLFQGAPIYESAIITEFLEDQFPTTPLLPADPLKRAQVRLWTYWCNHAFKPDLDLYKYEWLKMEAAEKEALRDRMEAHLKKLNDALEDGFLVGADYTLADIHIFPFYRQLQKAQPDFAKTFSASRADAWLEKIISRPAFIRAMEKSPGDR